MLSLGEFTAKRVCDETELLDWSLSRTLFCHVCRNGASSKESWFFSTFTGFTGVRVRFCTKFDENRFALFEHIEKITCAKLILPCDHFFRADPTGVRFFAISNREVKRAASRLLQNREKLDTRPLIKNGNKIPPDPTGIESKSTISSDLAQDL